MRSAAIIGLPAHLARPPLWPAAWQRWVGDVLLPAFLAQPVANASGAANDPTVRLFSFNPAKVSVPEAQQTIGYRLLRWAADVWEPALLAPSMQRL